MPVREGLCMHSFKLALVKVIGFILVFTLACTPSLIYYYKYGSENNNYKPELYEQNGKIDFLFCGASQSVWGFVPEVMDDLCDVNSFNISSGLLSWEGRYTIIKEVVENNPVKTLVMDLSYNSFARSNDTDSIEGTILLSEHLSFKSRVNFTMKSLSIDDTAVYIGYVLRTGSYGLVKSIFSKEQRKPEFAGKGYWSDKDPVSFVGKVYWQEGTYPEYKQYDCDSESVTYLGKIMEYCEQKGITVYLVTTPYPTRVISWSDRNGVLDVNKEIAQTYGCTLYDLNLYKDKDKFFNDETSYYDEEHLSTEGAVSCTKLLARLISENNEGIAGSNDFYHNYNEFIDAYFEKN